MWKFNQACFVGLGYIGLPTATMVAHSGLRVIGVDINQKVVETINSGSIHIIEPGLGEVVRSVVEAGMLRAVGAPLESDVYVVVVPTPFTHTREPDISYVESATRSILPLLKPDDLYILESTSPLGTTGKMANLIFRERPELKGQIHVAYCPERVLPGNVLHELVHNDRIIGGIDEASTARAREFYQGFVEGELHATDSRTAEMCKLTENSSRDVQIAFANELSMICDKAGIDVWELIALANKHPRVKILNPGCGVGGHCIAVDPYFITADFPREAQIIGTAREINNYKAFWCVEKIRNTILRFRMDQGRMPVVALMGLAFKPDIDDLRESPAEQIVRKLVEDAEVEFLVSEPNINEHPEFTITTPREACERSDIIVFLVAHSVFRSMKVDSGKTRLDFCGIDRLWN
jgi:UDP-N-acetyl-D-mannosaminuronic acid dehydrogenase